MSFCVTYLQLCDILSYIIMSCSFAGVTAPHRVVPEPGAAAGLAGAWLQRCERGRGDGGVCLRLVHTARQPQQR